MVILVHSLWAAASPPEGVGNTELRDTYEDWPPTHPQLTSTLYYPHSGSSVPTCLSASTSPTNSQRMFLKRQIWPVYSCVQDHQGFPVLLQQGSDSSPHPCQPWCHSFTLMLTFLQPNRLSSLHVGRVKSQLKYKVQKSHPECHI